MATVLSPLIESNNQHFDVVNKQMNGMTKAFYLHKDVEDPILRQLVNQPPIVFYMFEQP